MPGLFVAVAHRRPDAPAVLPKQVLLQFRVIASAVRSPTRAATGPHPVTDRKLLALSAIAGSPGMGVNQLAQALGVRQPTASQVVKTLAEQHLVDVHRDARDRRAVRICASAAGRALLQRLPAQFDFGDRLPEALARLDEGRLRSLELGLADLVQALTRPERPGPASRTDRPL